YYGTDDGGYDFHDGGEDPTDTDDDIYHGTHVAGTIAALTDNGSGVSGVGWNRVEVMPVRAVGANGGSTANLTDAIYYSAGSSETEADAPSKKGVVISMSLGGSGSDPAMYDAVEYAVDQGVTVIAAAGNDSGEVMYPAAFDNVLAVSATDIKEQPAYYTNTGPEIDFAAPGGDIRDGVDANKDGYLDGVLSTVGTEISFDFDPELEPKDGFLFLDGTSMATPHVSGVVGLLYSYAPNLTQDAVYAVLQNTAKDLGEPGHDEQYGHGLIDAEAALEYLINAGRDFPVQPRSSNTSSSGGTTSGGSSVSDATVEHLSAEGSGVTRGRGPSKRSGAILPEAGSDYQADSIIVKLTEEAAGGATQVGPAGSDSPGTGSTDGGGRAGAEAARALAAERGAGQPKALGGRLYRFDLASGDEVRRAIQALGQKADVEYAQPNYRYELID
ncbi:MAG: S8 family serine peptidase, partial [Spirochaetota bacterium]